MFEVARNARHHQAIRAAHKARSAAFADLLGILVGRRH
jgi:hypothetical protein